MTLRVLCDENVDEQYVETFAGVDWIAVGTVRELLTADATDEAISAYAAENDWVIFTSDDDFLGYDHDRGVLLYHQWERPSPGEVLDALRAIEDAYPNHDEIREFVPGGWVR